MAIEESLKIFYSHIRWGMNFPPPSDLSEICGKVSVLTKKVKLRSQEDYRKVELKKGRVQLIYKPILL